MSATVARNATTGGSLIDIQEILELLPHRFPFLLVDRVLALNPGKDIVALKNVTINEPFFGGHFPARPVMPGVLIIEAMAQAAGILSFKTPELNLVRGSIFYFAGIDHARFKRPVQPGDQLHLEAEILKIVRGVGKFKCRATVEGKLAAEGEILAVLKT
ncbi:MAG: 3-hydroxyacyl-ACP dehydratase FabZ [Burkholderiales bacterium]|nr:3-hydroxyacyl-ACP dehydratase FabZ [Burkholderiales bacterium]